MRTFDERARDVERLLAAARAVHAARARLSASIARSSGLSIEGVELGFASLETAATKEELRALIAAAGDAQHIHVILSANVFVAPLRAIALARAAAARVTVRPSSRDPVLARALIEAAGDAAITLAPERDADARADRIDVYGRDETIAAIRAAARPGVEVRGHGAGLGVAFVPGAGGPGSGAWAAAADELAADVVPFDQRGCLSPRVVFVEGPGERSDKGSGEGFSDHGQAFAIALHERLADWGRRIPRGALTDDERSAVVRWGDAVAFAGRVWTGVDHVVALAPGGRAGAWAPMLPPSGRHVIIVPVGSAADARAAIGTIAPFVVTVGSTDLDRAAEVAPPHARAARLGSMQRPALDGPVDRRSP